MSRAGAQLAHLPLTLGLRAREWTPAASCFGELEALGDGGDGALVGDPRTAEAIIQSGIGLGRDWRRG